MYGNTGLEDRYLSELAKTYPNKRAALSEIINLNAILNLPKGTEHFISDIHGEYEAYLHIRQNASGVIRNKIDLLFKNVIPEDERAQLATIIYYPHEKISEIKKKTENLDEFYKITLLHLIEICRLISSKYTRSKVRKHLRKVAAGFDYIIDELLNNDYDALNKDRYYGNIVEMIIEIGASEDFIVAISDAIKSLVIDHLHVVGDIFDRGTRPDIIIDEMMTINSLDIQWGNHDILWMGAASGSPVCIATVLANSLRYKNLDLLEIGYGISMRPLCVFADSVYKHSSVSRFFPVYDDGGDCLSLDNDELIARMYKAISIISFKLEIAAIDRNPDFGMEDRRLLERINFEHQTIEIGGKVYHLEDTDFPTVSPDNPSDLTEYEKEVMDYFVNAFLSSEKLQRHIAFLYDKGGIYKIYNGNLLFHGCTPLDSKGDFLKLKAAQNKSGKDLFDYCDGKVRSVYKNRGTASEKQTDLDFMWYLWCGRNSPLSGRDKIATFEHLLIDDQSAGAEPRNYYYSFWDDEVIIERILHGFGVSGDHSHIINGHMPVHRNEGETPIKANGKLIVIDGGFCKAYQKTTGIAGYTLIYNAQGMKILAHEHFTGKKNSIMNNTDILSDTVVFETSNDTILVKDTEKGKELSERIFYLKQLLQR